MIVKLGIISPGRGENQKGLKPPSSGGIPNSIEKKYNHDESVCTIVYSNEKEKRPHKVFPP